MEDTPKETKLHEDSASSVDSQVKFPTHSCNAIPNTADETLHPYHAGNLVAQTLVGARH